jgi:hypothetical protein
VLVPLLVTCILVLCRVAPEVVPVLL